MSRREREFRDWIATLRAQNVATYYTSKLPPDIGSRSYWAAHGFKVPPDAERCGVQLIMSALTIVDVFYVHQLIELRGPGAEHRRALYRAYQAMTLEEQREWLWQTYLEPCFEVEIAGRSTVAEAVRTAFSGEAMTPLDKQRRDLGYDVWDAFYVRLRLEIYPHWRVSKALGEELDRRFALQVHDQFGYLPKIIDPARTPQQEADDIPW